MDIDRGEGLTGARVFLFTGAVLAGRSSLGEDVKCSDTSLISYLSKHLSPLLPFRPSFAAARRGAALGAGWRGAVRHMSSTEGAATVTYPYKNRTEFLLLDRLPYRRRISSVCCRPIYLYPHLVSASLHVRLSIGFERSSDSQQRFHSSASFEHSTFSSGRSFRCLGLGVSDKQFAIDAILPSYELLTLVEQNQSHSFL